MTEAIERFFLETVGRELCVFFCAMLPIIECRGAIPLGWGLGLPWWQTALFSIAGNLLPVPFILLFLNNILTWMEGTKTFSSVARWLKERAHKKSDTYYKYEMLGLFLLVAVPLPGTGAWTGSLVAAVMGLKMKRAIPAIALGVAAAGIIIQLKRFA